MSKKSEVIKGTESVNVTTWHWKTYGEHIERVVVAASELVANAIDAAMMCPGRRRVDIDIENRGTLRWLVIKNSGMPFADLGEAMNYGYENDDEREKCRNAKGPGNQYGTGLKGGFSFFYPLDNGLFNIYTRKQNNSNEYMSISSPYGEQMKVNHHTGKFPYPEWVSTVVETAVAAPIDLTTLKEDISKNFTMVFLMDAVRKARGETPIDMEIRFGGEPLKAIVPLNVDECGNTVSALGVTETWNIKGVEVEATKFEFTLPDGLNLEEYGHYYPSKEKQGWYLFSNMRLICHEQLDGILKQKGCFDLDGGSGKFLSVHDSMNHMITFLNIDIKDRRADLPLTCHKSDVDWRKANGQEYRVNIDKFVGPRFREKTALHLERTLREVIDKFFRKYYASQKAIYATECYVNEDKDFRVDAAVIMLNGPKGAMKESCKPTIQSNMVLSEKFFKKINDNPILKEHGYTVSEVGALIEFKKNDVALKKYFLQLWGYAIDFKRKSGYFPPSYLISGSINKKTKDFIDFINMSEGYNIHFIDVNELLNE